jgi:hypothetical protein
VLNLVDSIGSLTSNRFEGPEVINLSRELYQRKMIREGLVPPSESTITVHELIHKSDQILSIGAPIHNNLYKFERVNKNLKSMLQNVARGFPSIMKNYMEKESVFFDSALNLDEVDRIRHFNKYGPSNGLTIKSLKSYLQPLHVYREEDAYVLVDLPNNDCISLYGERKTEKFSKSLFAHILHDAMQYSPSSSPDNSLLQMLYDEWILLKGSKKPEAFFKFLSDSFNISNRTINNNSVYFRYSKIILDMEDKSKKEIYQSDFNFLLKCFSVPVGNDISSDDYLFTT